MLEDNLRKERWVLFILFFSLSLLGVLMVYESSSMYAFGQLNDASYFVQRQIVFLIFGIFSCFLVLLIPFKILSRYAKEIFLANVILLIAVLFIGKRVGGATRWFHLPFFQLQPSELLKATFLIYVANFLVRKGNLIRSVKWGLLPLGVTSLALFLLLLLQPDLGAVFFWGIWLFFFLFLNQAKKKHLITVFFGGLLSAVVLVKVCPYRFRRITAYLNPFADPQGAGFQLVQSQIAYGNGGVVGVGFGQGSQKLFFLPAAHTDFVFSIFAEEFGFMGSIFLLAFLFFVFHRMARMIRFVSDPFRKNVMWGVLLIFFLEVIINIGVSCGLFPTKGLSLPFLSYGGSNLITHFVLLGLFFNASKGEITNDKSQITNK